MTASSPRTFAIVTDADVIERWQAACVTGLLAAGVPVRRWIYRSAGEPKPAPGAAALATVSSDDLPAGLPAPEPALTPEQPAALDVDTVLDLTREGHVHPAIAGRETWSFAFGPTGGRDPVRAAMLEILRGSGPFRIELRATPGDRVLMRGAIRTTTGSLESQLDRMLLEPAAWPAQLVLRAGDGDHAWPIEPATLPTGSGRDHADHADAPDVRIPQRVLRLGVAGRHLLTSVDALVRHSEWTIGLVRRPIEDWLGSVAVPEVSWLPRRPGRFAADPFGIEDGDRVHVLFEDFDQRRGRGVIATSTVDAAGAWSEPEIVLDTGSHASYPYLFEADGAIWMVPETSDLGELRLYRAVEFPRRWALERRLLNDQVSDATIVSHDGRWWMFGTSRGRGVDEALRVWHAPALTGPWQLHALDPVKIDAGSARPGGTPFVSGGRLYRPAQDCSTRYGGRITINRVDVLAPSHFEERSVGVVNPTEPFRDGLHTLSAAGAATLIDGNRIRLVPDALRFRLSARLRGT